MPELNLTNEIKEVWRIYNVKFNKIGRESAFGYSIYNVGIDTDNNQGILQVRSRWVLNF